MFKQIFKKIKYEVFKRKKLEELKDIPVSNVNPNELILDLAISLTAIAEIGMECIDKKGEYITASPEYRLETLAELSKMITQLYNTKLKYELVNADKIKALIIKNSNLVSDLTKLNMEIIRMKKWLYIESCKIK